MVVMDDDGGGRQRRQWQTTKVADDDDMQDQVADYKVEEGEWTANNNSIRHKADKPAGQRAWKNKEIKFTQKSFFQ
jgi:hypothetical protein